MVSEKYLKLLEKKDASIVIVEDECGNSKRFEVNDKELMDIWLNNKRNKRARGVLVEKAKEYHTLYCRSQHQKNLRGI